MPWQFRKQKTIRRPWTIGGRAEQPERCNVKEYYTNLEQLTDMVIGQPSTYG